MYVFGNTSYDPMALYPIWEDKAAFRRSQKYLVVSILSKTNFTEENKILIFLFLRPAKPKHGFYDLHTIPLCGSSESVVISVISSTFIPSIQKEYFIAGSDC